MHMPDRVLTPEVWATLDVASVGLVGGAVYKTRQRLEPRDAPLMAVMAAFIFAAQMVNFPVALGVSGHLIGATLAAVLLGIGPAVLIMTAVLVIQALVFQDGGLMALGANVFNLALVAPVVGYLVYGTVLRHARGPASPQVAAFLGAWLSVVATAAVAGIQLVLSGYAAIAIIPGILLWHLAIGIGEGLITVAALQLVWKAKPEMAPISGEAQPPRIGRTTSVVGLLAVASVLALALSPLASPSPDGLERVAHDAGLAEKFEHEPILPGALPDYTTPGVEGEAASTAIAGVIGALLVLIPLAAVVWLITWGKGQEEETAQDAA